MEQQVDGFMWTTRQYVLTPAALQLYVVGEDAPCDVILVENVKELAVGVGEQAVDVLLHCWNASRYSLPQAPKTREMLTWRLRLESSGSRAEFTTSFADAMRRLQVRDLRLGHLASGHGCTIRCRGVGSRAWERGEPVMPCQCPDPLCEVYDTRVRDAALTRHSTSTAL